MYKPLSNQLNNCRCCPRNCGVDRNEGSTGYCKTGKNVQVSHAGLHFGEEPPISGTNGSGTIFFTGCNLRCVFCQNYQISQEFRPDQMRTLATDELALEMLRLQDEGAHNINFVSPSHVIYQMADAILAARSKGLAIPVVYNSNGYDSVGALRQIRGLVDIYLPDLKYLENDHGRQFSGTNNYADIVPNVMAEMLDQVGHLEMDGDGIAMRGVLVRHLALPGFMSNSRKCLNFLASLSPDIYVSIMSQYSPQYKALEGLGPNRTLTKNEYDEITDYALELGLENAFIQEFESQNIFLPDFTLEKPFDLT